MKILRSFLDFISVSPQGDRMGDNNSTKAPAKGQIPVQSFGKIIPTYITSRSNVIPVLYSNYPMW